MYLFINSKKSCWVILFLLAGCQNYDRSARLWLINRTNHPIYYWISCDSSFQDIQMSKDYRLKPQDSVMPYLLYGPEGKGDNKNTWINAINRADDSALHVFFYYIDFRDDPNLGDSLYHLIIRRRDYKVRSLVDSGWKVSYYQTP